jgi:carboxylesterase type B
MGVWSNTAAGATTGAYHNAEIPMIFGTTESKAGATKDTPEEAKLSKHMMHAWASFAKDPEQGLLALGWPLYDPASMFISRLGLAILITD